MSTTPASSLLGSASKDSEDPQDLRLPSFVPLRAVVVLGAVLINRMHPVGDDKTWGLEVCLSCLSAWISLIRIPLRRYQNSSELYGPQRQVKSEVFEGLKRICSTKWIT